MHSTLFCFMFKYTKKDTILCCPFSFPTQRRLFGIGSTLEVKMLLLGKHIFETLSHTEGKQKTGNGRVALPESVVTYYINCFPDGSTL